MSNIVPIAYLELEGKKIAFRCGYPIFARRVTEISGRYRSYTRLYIKSQGKFFIDFDCDVVELLEAIELAECKAYERQADK